MDESELEKIRANIRWVWACDDIELTDDQVEVCLRARLKADEYLEQRGSQENRDQRARAVARARKEGRPFDEVMLEEGRALHQAYWDAKRSER